MQRALLRLDLQWRTQRRVWQKGYSTWVTQATTGSAPGIVLCCTMQLWIGRCFRGGDDKEGRPQLRCGSAARLIVLLLDVVTPWIRWLKRPQWRMRRQILRMQRHL